MPEDPRPNRPTAPAVQKANLSTWRARPITSIALRLAAILVPALAAGGGAYIAGRAAPPPSGPAIVLWWLSLLGLATVVGVLVERLARRILPLAVLLQLSLAFPDRAPSRFAIARTAGNVRHLEGRIADAKERGFDDDPARAAHQILELVAALSAHDRKTRGHSERVRAFTDMLAAELPIDPDDRDRLRWAALLHDVGKLHVPPRILNKPAKPDPHEWERLKEHPQAGAQLVRPLLPWLGTWAATIPQHHERFDGRGYPRGLAGGEISLGARIVAVADSFEVMTAARAYKRPMSVPAARRELAACAAAQFDPDIVRAFLNISLGKLLWTVGPASWLAATPMLGSLQRVASQAAVAAKTAAVTTAFGVAGAVAQPTLAASPHEIGQPTGTGLAGSSGALIGPAQIRSAAPGGTEETSGAVEQRPDSDGSDGGRSEGGRSPGDRNEDAPALVDAVEGVAGGAIGGVIRTVDDVAGAVDDLAGTVIDDAGRVVDDGIDAVDDLLGL